MLIRRRRLEIRLPLFATDLDSGGGTEERRRRSRFVWSWLNNRPRTTDIIYNGGGAASRFYSIV